MPTPPPPRKWYENANSLEKLKALRNEQIQMISASKESNVKKYARMELVKREYDQHSTKLPSTYHDAMHVLTKHMGAAGPDRNQMAKQYARLALATQKNSAKHGVNMSPLVTKGRRSHALRIPLHEAVYAGDHATIQNLLHLGANPHASRLMDYANLKTVKILHEAGAKFPSDFLYMGAVIRKDLPLARYVLEHGAPRETPGLIALSTEQPEMLQLLVKHGVPIDQRDEDGKTALQTATTAKTIDLLLALGANPRIADGRGMTPLHSAVKAGRDTVILTKLLDAGALVDARTTTSLMTPLFYARKADQVELLVARGASIEARNNYRRTPFIHFVANGDEVAAALKIAELGAKVNAKDTAGNTAMHYVDKRSSSFVPEEYINFVKKLIELGCDVSVKNNAGNTPLHFAKRPQIARVLLSYGASPDEPNNENSTPFHGAKADPIIIEMLLAAPGNHRPALQMRNAEGKMPIDYALEPSQLEVFKALVEAGSPLPVRALHRVVDMLSEFLHTDDEDNDYEDEVAQLSDWIRLLIKHGASTTEKDQFGALPFAPLYTVRNLLDPDLRNLLDATALPSAAKRQRRH